MFARYSSAIVTGSATTFFLFFVMQSLIALQPGAAGATRIKHSLGIAKVRDERPVDIDDFSHLPEPVTELPETPRWSTEDPGTTSPIGLPPVKAPTPIDAIDGTSFRMTDGPLVAIVRVQPVYPTQPLSRGLEGWVLVEFDVRPDGSVSNAFVVQSSHRSFERSALDAVQKFRYKARVVGGIPQATTGLQNLFRFEISHD